MQKDTIAKQWSAAATADSGALFPVQCISRAVQSSLQKVARHCSTDSGGAPKIFVSRERWIVLREKSISSSAELNAKGLKT